MMKRVIANLLALLLAISVLPALAADTPLGPGDGLKISVFGNPDLSLETKVSQDGNITFPLLGVVQVAGISSSEAEKKISGMLVNGGFLKQAEVNIIVTDLQSQTDTLTKQVVDLAKKSAAAGVSRAASLSSCMRRR